MNSSTRSSTRVVVVGGGLSGTAAVSELLLATSDTEVVWIEADSRWGGRVHSVSLDGPMAELGAAFALDPRILVSNDPPRNPPTSPETTDETDETDEDLVTATVEEIGLVASGVLHRATTVEGCLAAHLGHEAFGEVFAFGSRMGALLLGATGALGPRDRSPVGDVGALSVRTAEAVGAFYGLIHPGPFAQASPVTAPGALTAWACTRRRHGNARLLGSWREQLLATHGPSGRLRTRGSTRLVAVREEAEAVVVHLATQGSGDVERLDADALILATTPSTLVELGLEVAAPHDAFYSAATYHPGIVLAFTAAVGPRPVRFAVAVDEPWSSAIVGSDPDDTTAPRSVVQVYLAGPRATRGWERSDTDLLSEVITSLGRHGIIASSTEPVGVVKRWREVGPSLSTDLLASWRPGHRRLSPRIVFGGELAAFDGRGGGYGTASAIRGGRLAARDVNDVILAAPQTTGADPDAETLEPLLDVHVYRIGGHRPTVIARRREGDVAFHGLVMAARPDPDLADALWAARTSDGLWEFHRGFHPTLEDSCLVLEGLRVDPTRAHPDLGPRRRQEWNEAVAILVERFAHEETGCWTTTRAGRAEYWRDPTVDGAAWGAWLAHQADPDRWRSLIDATARWLWSRRDPAGTWTSGWFVHREISDFLATRLIGAVAPTGSPETGELALAMMARQHPSGSFGDSIVATSARLLAFSHLLAHTHENSIVDRDRLQAAGDRARRWLTTHGPTRASEPVLYYWFENRTGLPPGERLFFHAHDRGRITLAWARWALDTWDHATTAG